MPADRPSLDTSRTFTRAAGLTAGLSRRVLGGSALRTVLRGVYIDASVPDSTGVRVEAALLLFHESAFASHASAARVRGVPLPPLPEEHVSVLDPDHRRSRAGIRCHVVAAADVETVGGLRVSATCQMFMELAALLTLVDLVVVGDHLVRRAKATGATVAHASVTSAAFASSLPPPKVSVDERPAGPPPWSASGSTRRWRPAFVSCSCWLGSRSRR